MIDVQLARLPYDPDKFVDRADEVHLVLDKAHRIADGQYVEKRVVIFYGPRGAGKTWVIHEIERRLRQEMLGTLVIRIDMASLATMAAQQAIEQIIGQIDATFRLYTQTGIASENQRLDVLSMQLMDNVKRVTGLIVFLFDHIDESPVNMLDLLESRLLSPLAAVPTTLIVLGGRGEHVWKDSLHLRLRSNECDLLPFTLQHTREQLEAQASRPMPRVEDILPVTAGYPLSNWVLANYLGDESRAVQICIDMLLSGGSFASTQITHLEALCVLRCFSDEMMRPMFVAYFDDDEYSKWSYRQCREARRRLISTALVQWDGEAGGYIIDAALKGLLEYRLYLRDPDHWQRMHTEAKNLFSTWLDEYPRSLHRWQKEMTYHINKLTYGPLWTPDPQEGQV